FQRCSSIKNLIFMSMSYQIIELLILCLRSLCLDQVVNEL
ncbi:1255_t:CDS:1, partial [Scutellospora calospora]